MVQAEAKEQLSWVMGGHPKRSFRKWKFGLISGWKVNLSHCRTSGQTGSGIYSHLAGLVPRFGLTRSASVSTLFISHLAQAPKQLKEGIGIDSCSSAGSDDDSVESALGSILPETG